MSESWPHAPPHWTFSPGTYFVTASTYHRQHFLHTDKNRQIVMDSMMDSSSEHGWQMKAWVILSNHYHLLAHSPASGGDSLDGWLRNFHRTSARRINKEEGTPGRRIWMNYRESLITHQTSFLARLNYIHQNPMKHGVVATADQYEWSSYRWFATHAPVGLVESVSRFGSDCLNIWDDF